MGASESKRASVVGQWRRRQSRFSGRVISKVSFFGGFGAFRGALVGTLFFGSFEKIQQIFLINQPRMSEGSLTN